MKEILLTQKINKCFTKVYARNEDFLLSFTFEKDQKYSMETFDSGEYGTSIALLCIQDMLDLLLDAENAKISPVKKSELKNWLKNDFSYDDEMKIFSCYQLKAGWLIYYYDGYTYYHLEIMTFDKKIHAFCVGYENKEETIDLIAKGLGAKKIEI